MKAMSPRREKRQSRNGQLPDTFTEAQARKGVTVKASDDYALMVTVRELEIHGGYLARGWNAPRAATTPNRLYVLKDADGGKYRLKRVFKTKDGRANPKFVKGVKALRELDVQAARAAKAKRAK